MTTHEDALLASLTNPVVPSPRQRPRTTQKTQQTEQAPFEDLPAADQSQLDDLPYQPLDQYSSLSSPHILESLPVPFAAAFGYLVFHFLLSSLLSPLFAEFASLVLQCLISSALYISGRYRLATLAAIGALISQLSVLLFRLQ